MIVSVFYPHQQIQLYNVLVAVEETYDTVMRADGFGMGPHQSHHIPVYGIVIVEPGCDYNIGIDRQKASDDTL